jgi:hypothetical protein
VESLNLSYFLFNPLLAFGDKLLQLRLVFEAKSYKVWGLGISKTLRTSTPMYRFHSNLLLAQ